MTHAELTASFADLSTPLVADACLRLGLPVRLAPRGLTPVLAGSKVAGRVLPVRHYGSVDVFLEAFAGASAGDVLVLGADDRERDLIELPGLTDADAYSRDCQVPDVGSESRYRRHSAPQGH